MTVSRGDFTKDFWGKCGDCSHVWVAAKYPCPVDVFVAQTLNQRCPSCGSEKVLVAKQGHGELQEARADA